MARFSGTRAVAITQPGGAAAALGLLIVAWPLAWAPGWAYVVAVLVPENRAITKHSRPAPAGRGAAC